MLEQAPYPLAAQGDLVNVLSLNINGLKSAIGKGWLQWLESGNWDVVCLQEVKSHPGSLPLLLIESLGYRALWHPARRKGYSGVAIWSRLPLESVEYGLGIPEFDIEGRAIRARIGGIRVTSVYVPAGSASSQRQAYKERFLAALQAWCQSDLVENPEQLVAGDLNIARRPLDVDHPDAAAGHSGFLEHEREWLERWLDQGWLDAFATLHPQQFSPTWWWRGGTESLAGPRWRLDYQLVSRALWPRVRAVTHWPQIEVSDHCPVGLELAGPGKEHTEGQLEAPKRQPDR